VRRRRWPPSSLLPSSLSDTRCTVVSSHFPGHCPSPPLNRRFRPPVFIPLYCSVRRWPRDYCAATMTSRCGDTLGLLCTMSGMSWHRDSHVCGNERGALVDWESYSGFRNLFLFQSVGWTNWIHNHYSHKILNTTQPPYLYELVSIQPPYGHNTLPLPYVTLIKPPSSLKVTHRSFQHASPHLWIQLPTSLSIPHPNYSSLSQRPWTCRFNLPHTAITFHHFFAVWL